MMEVIAHRGFWQKRSEMNTASAFAAALASGFGIETDVRDSAGILVISHDMPDLGKSLSLKEFLEIFKKSSLHGTIALNVKADGLGPEIRAMMAEYNVSNYFCFDMSIPETVKFIKHEITFFARRSEIEEPDPHLVERAEGTWLDAFYSSWPDFGDVESLLRGGKKVALVSPELHGRSDYLKFWARFKRFRHESRFMICTDYPEQARRFFEIGNNE